jgi:hypothetical protein
MVPFPRRLPHTISPLEGDGFEPSVPRGESAAVDEPYIVQRQALANATTGPEIEVTEEMIAAGVEVLRLNYFDLVDSVDGIKERVVRDYLCGGGSASGAERPVISGHISINFIYRSDTFF